MHFTKLVVQREGDIRQGDMIRGSHVRNENVPVPVRLGEANLKEPLLARKSTI